MKLRPAASACLIAAFVLSPLTAAPARAQASGDVGRVAKPPEPTAEAPTTAGAARAARPGSGAAAASVAAASTARRVAAVTVVTAAGSVLWLADGVVTGARLAQILPPAPGFEYER